MLRGGVPRRMLRGVFAAEEWHRDYSAEEFRGDSEEYFGEYSAE